MTICSRDLPPFLLGKLGRGGDVVRAVSGHIEVGDHGDVSYMSSAVKREANHFKQFLVRNVNAK